MLFKPQIINNYSEIREKSVWIDLFDQSKKIKDTPVESTKQLSINKNSKKITEKIRYRQYKKIFDALLPQLGKIKYTSIDFKSADSRMIEIIYPIIQELAESRLELDFGEFCQALDGLIRVLTPQDKWYLIFTYSNEKDC